MAPPARRRARESIRRSPASRRRHVKPSLQEDPQQSRERKDSIELFYFAAIGALAGWLACQFMKGHGFGFLVDMMVGVFGAIVGAYFIWPAGLPVGNDLLGRLIVAALGAGILLVGVRLVTDRSPGRKLWS